jgi:AraC-like DNA-binding protein
MAWMTSQPEPFTFSDLLSWVETVSDCLINFHDVTGITLEVPKLSVPAKWQYHHGPYCEFVKLQGNQPRCLATKARSVEKAKALREPFEGVCPQGIWDLAYPVVFGEDVVAVLYLGSFKAGELRPVADKAYAGPVIPAVTPDKKAALLEHGGFLAHAIRLILSEFMASGRRLSKRRPPDFYRGAVRAFIQNHYQEDIRLKDFAAQLHIHPNYLGQLIKKSCGLAFRDLLTEHRIEKAKVLLSAGAHTVTETAYACGFNDSNYFSTVFRRRTRMTPRELRGRKERRP